MTKLRITFLLLFTSTSTQADPITRILDPATGSAQAVTVSDSALVHTTQFMAIDSNGDIVGKGDPLAQTVNVIDRLEETLKACETGMEKIVKINVYARDTQTADKVREYFKRRFAGPDTPAVSYVETLLPHPDADVAMDAVVATDLGKSGEPLKLKRPDSDYGIPDIAHAALLPIGPTVYVSGQAEKGPLVLATRKTLESLEKTLKFVGLDLTRVVQVKSFLAPMADADVVREEIDAFFGKIRTPPLVFVEWRSSYPIEIELLAAGKKGVSGAVSQSSVEYLTPPEMSASPIYSKIARVHSSSRIYIAGLYGESGAGAGEQTEQVFASLKSILQACSSGFKNLVKATYYVSDSEASGMLNELRPNFYDPERPPAASKAMVKGVGMDGCTTTLDMIAVPTE